MGQAPHKPRWAYAGQAMAELAAFSSVFLFMIYNFVMTYIVYRLLSQSLIDGTHSQEVSHTALWIPQVVIVFGMLVTDLRIIVDLVSSLAKFKVDTAKRLSNADIGV